MKAAMKASFFKTCLLLFFINTSVFTFSSAAAIRGAYYPAYSSIPLSSLDTSYFTHLYYAFLVPDANSNFNTDDATGQSYLDFTTSLHSKNPPVTALFSIGGGGNEKIRVILANIISSASTRNTFITNTIQIARKYGFDGMDLDWENPLNEIEMGNFGSLMEEWRTAIVSDSTASNKPQLLLTAAVHYASSFFDESDTRAYPVDSINKNMDWINAMAYDFHGNWDTSATGAPAALYDPPNGKVSASYGLNSWINAGLEKNKLVLGSPLYGYTWTLKDPSVSGIGAPAVGVGPTGVGADAGVMKYNEIQQYITDHNARVVLNTTIGTAYAVDGSVWIGYDGIRSTALKVKYAQNLGIGGYFLWVLGDDLNNQISQSAFNAWTS